MSESAPPTKKSSLGLLLLGGLLVLIGGGAVFWKLNQKPKEQVVEERVKLAPAPSAAESSDEAMPPPPSVEEVAPTPSAAPSDSGVTKSSGPSGCLASCPGSAGAALQSALRARGGQARGCYERALRTNSQLAGKMSVQIKLSPTGSVCSASISGDTLGDAAVSSCVLSNFRSGVYPAPQGGCVATEVPLNFISKQ